MSRLLMAALFACLVIPAYAADKPLLGPAPAASLNAASINVTCARADPGLALTPSTVRLASRAAAQNPCARCGSVCESKTRACEGGSIKACYEAAACLCQCNLDAGGCGSSRDALQQCVRDNQRAADELR